MKFLIIPAALWLNATVLMAQESFVGVMGGAGLGYFSPRFLSVQLTDGEGNVIKNSSPMPIIRPSVTLTSQLGITPHFAFAPQLAFASVGEAAKDYPSRTGSEIKARVSLQQFRLPLMARVLFGERAFRFYLQAGPSPAVNVHYRFTTGDKSFDENSYSLGKNAIFRRFDLAVAGGTGFLVRHKDNWAIIDLMYHHSLNQASALGISARQRLWLLQAGYAWILSGPATEGE